MCIFISDLILILVYSQSMSQLCRYIVIYASQYPIESKSLKLTIFKLDIVL